MGSRSFEYREEEVPADLKPLVPGFLLRRQKEVSELQALLEARNFESIRFIAHKLKGNGAGYGFQSISDLGRELEQAAITQQTELVADLIGQLSGLVTELQARW